MKQLSDEVDEGILATSTDSGIMNKIKEEVTEGLLETSGNFNEIIKTIKEEVDGEAGVDYTNDVPMQLFSYGSDSHDIDGAYDEYEIIMKVEPELWKSDKLQNELDSSHSCSQCDFVTSQKYYLDIHNEMVHSRGENTDPVKRASNGKEEHSRKGTERDHKTLQHDSVKDLTKTHFKQARKCKYCAFVAPRKSALLSHMRIHKVVRTCSHCHFTSHLRTVYRKHDCFFKK